MSNNQIYDVIIVGAGFAGLSSAFYLEKNNKDINILILEADDEIGGRSFNKYLSDGTLLELGGQWIGYRHKEMFKFVNELKLKIFVTPPFSQGKSFYYYNSRLNEKPEDDFYELAYSLDKMASTINLQAPWEHEKAREWDNITFEQYLKTVKASEESKKLLTKIVISGILSNEPDKVSLLQTLFYIQSSGGFDYAVGTIEGAQNYRIQGGIFQVADKISKQLQRTEIILNEEVEKIDDCETEVKIITKNGKNYVAKKCILAISPVAVNNIIFEKSFEEGYQKLLKSYQPGRALKVNFTFQEPFWIKYNKNGSITSTTGFLTEIVDNSVPNSSKGILTAFIYGDKREEILNFDLRTRKQVLVEELIKFFGPEARHCQDFIEFNWSNNSWTGGCFSATLVPGALSEYGKYWRKPQGSIHFASTETSPEFYGYFEGAVLSGKRVANEIVSLFKK